MYTTVLRAWQRRTLQGETASERSNGYQQPTCHKKRFARASKRKCVTVTRNRNGGSMLTICHTDIRPFQSSSCACCIIIHQTRLTSSNSFLTGDCDCSPLLLAVIRLCNRLVGNWRVVAKECAPTAASLVLLLRATVAYTLKELWHC